MREAQARSRAVHLAPSRGDARDRGGGAAGGGAGSLSLSCGPTLGTRASGRAMRAMRAGDVGRITPRHARRMWPPRPRGRWRRPACRRRGPGASSWDRGCAQAWLGCRVDIGSIEALVRLGSLYDTLATHTDASHRNNPHIPPNHSPVRSMSGAQVTDGPEPHVTDRAITNPGN